MVRGGDGRLQWMRAATVPVLVLLMSARVRGQLGGGQPLINTAFVTGETALCCTAPDFGNADSAPELQPCRQVQPPPPPPPPPPTPPVGCSFRL